MTFYPVMSCYLERSNPFWTIIGQNGQIFNKTLVGRGKRKMPHTHCQAFKTNGEPCTNRLRPNRIHPDINDWCGMHNLHIGHELLTQQFNRIQARRREAWNRRQQPAGEPAPPAAPVERPACGHIMTGARVCARPSAGHADGKCTLHHNLIVRRTEEQPIHDAIAWVRRMYRIGVPLPEIDQEVARRIAGMAHHVIRQRTQIGVDDIILAPYEGQINRLLNQGGTLEQVNAQIEEWQNFNVISQRRGDILQARAERMLAAIRWRQEWQQNRPAPPPRFGPDQREAQLAADSQNVHTKEITAQMRDSLAMLLAVEVPDTQQNTIREIRECWDAQGNIPSDVGAVYRDITDWWNRKTIFNTNDKLYKRCLRGLWWTIKQYRGETKTELEKRLWQECKEGALPYSVCVQGHMARLSNVMVGFDEAFVPPVPVGEILQQKMAAISAMDIEYEKQIQMAEELLAELKIPHEEHKNWLAAF